MDILEMSWEDIEKEYQPKSIYKDLTLEEAIRMLELYANRIRDLKEELSSAYNYKSELDMYRYAEGAREQAMRGAQGIFG